MSVHLEVILIAVVVSVSCALPGTLLVLRKMSLMSDAISHALLPGIVLAFFVTENLESPLLIVGAVLFGILTVSLTDLIKNTNLVKEDAAMGLVFPFLFSIGVILVSRHAGNVHLDVDAVLLGELAFAPFDRFIIAGYDIGPRSLYSMMAILLINTALILLFYKELKLSTFDPGLAATIGFMPLLVHYGIMVMVSVTAVGAFDSVGSILVVALMIAPPSTALLYTKNLGRTLILSSALGAGAAILGYASAYWLDVSIAGSMAVWCGILFLVAFLTAPEQGLVSNMKRRKRQKIDFAISLLTVHLSHHHELEDDFEECKVEHLQEHINWSRQFASQIVDQAKKSDFVRVVDGFLILTESGREKAQKSMET